MPCFRGFCRFQCFSVSVRLVMTAGVLLAGGCMQIPRAPLTPPHWSGSGFAPTADPFLNSPPQSVPQQTPAPVPDEAPQPTFGEDYSAPTPVQSNRSAPVDALPASPNPTENSINPNVQPPRLEAPTITPEDVTVPLILNLKVQAPETNRAGEVSVFEITLQNPSDHDAEDVVIESRFEEGFVFPGSTDQQVNQTIGTLKAGETRQVKLSLKSHRAGYHCVEFRLLAKGAEPVTKKVCVKYQDSAVSLEVRRPGQTHGRRQCRVEPHRALAGFPAGDECGGHGGLRFHLSQARGRLARGQARVGENHLAFGNAAIFGAGGTASRI